MRIADTSVDPSILSQLNTGVSSFSIPSLAIDVIYEGRSIWLFFGFDGSGLFLESGFYTWLIKLEHIAARHPEMAGYKDEVLRTVSDPDLIQQGDYETLLAIRRSMKSPFNLKNIIVVYKEKIEVDGFIITTYFATELSGWRKVLWRR